MTDDVSRLRAAKGADAFEVFVSNFPGVEIEPALAGGFYGVALGLVKLDREVRGEVLRAGVAESANDVLVTHNELNWA